MQQLQCQSCGDALQIENQFVKSVTCRSCGSTYVISGEGGLDPQGKTVSLADYPSRLSVGARGKIKGRGFMVLGRIRYVYDAGFWEEWQINWDDGEAPDWLEEDEGNWTVYRRGRIRGEIPPYDQVNVGQTINASGKPFFVTEKRRAKVGGSEGQFAAVFPLNETFGYITGAVEGQITSINYWSDEIELSFGMELEHGDMVIES
ncbi:MAG: DUF4178 domain-containing protein [Chloroflexi bacterium]|nr:DUF4178 domain-containing protein [Chloroflexota bacterium]